MPLVRVGELGVKQQSIQLAYFSQQCLNNFSLTDSRDLAYIIWQEKRGATGSKGLPSGILNRGGVAIGPFGEVTIETASNGLPLETRPKNAFRVPFSSTPAGARNQNPSKPGVLLTLPPPQRNWVVLHLCPLCCANTTGPAIYTSLIGKVL
jgi:hypothetical protein